MVLKVSLGEQPGWTWEILLRARKMSAVVEAMTLSLGDNVAYPTLKLKASVHKHFLRARWNVLTSGPLSPAEKHFSVQKVELRGR